MDFERLSARHRDAVYRQMVRVCGNFDDAEDALVEALAAAYRHSSQLRDSSSFPAWLSMIGRRVCGRIKKKQKLMPLVELGVTLPAEAGDPHGELESQHLKQCVRGAVDTLPENLRSVYLLREIEGRPAEETAARLGLTVANVKSRLHRARIHVRRHLDKSLCDE